MNLRNAAVPESAVPNLPSLLSITIDQAGEGLQSGRFTSVDLVKAYLSRIEEAAEFRAVLEVNPDVLEAAQRLDDEREKSGSRGPLHGVPILVKDNIVTKDSLEASAGSYALLGAKPALESSVVARLREAGVIVLGKSNLSEWANFRGLNITGGWSPRGGQTLGTYYPDCKPEGSSAGSAVGTSLGLCLAALGTETMGSIIDPAEINNVVGFKPTRGLVANDGAIPISKRQDVIGTLTRTVKDAAHMFNYMAGKSERDERTWKIPLDPIPDFTTFCTQTDLTGVAIGVPRNAIPKDAPLPIIDAFESALRILTAAGAEVTDKADFPAVEEFTKLNQQVKGIVRSSEFKRDIALYLESLEKNPYSLRSAEDIIEFTKSRREEGYPDQDIGKFLWPQAESIDVHSEKYRHMVDQETYFGGEGSILGAMTKHNVHVLATPSTLGMTNDLAAKMGFPVMSIPMGFWPEDTPIQRGNGGLVTKAPGVPFCLMLVTKAFSEDKLFQVAYAFEQLSAVRVNGPPPFKVPRTELEDVRRG